MFPTGTRWSLSGNTGQRSGIADTQAGNREKAAQAAIAHECFIQVFSGHVYAVQCNM